MFASGVFSFIFFAVSCSGLNIEIKIQNDPQCKFKGQQCSSDLKNIIYCTAEKGNSYVVTSCPGERKCGKDRDGEYSCLNEAPDFPDTVRNDTVFTCQGEGGFPDGYRCAIGYMCPSAGTFPELVCECPADMAMTFFPRFECVNNEDIKESCRCPYVDRCKNGFSVSDFGENCHGGYFYFCKRDEKGGFSPEVHKCPNNQIFVDGRCVNPSAQISSGSSAKNVKPDCKPYNPPCLPEPNVKCTKKGELLPHKVTRCYYFCTGDLKAVVRDCGKGSYFTCKYGECGCVFGPKPQ